MLLDRSKPNRTRLIRLRYSLAGTAFSLASALSLVAAFVSASAASAAVTAMSDDADRADESVALTEWLSQAGLDEILAVMLDEQVRKSATSSPAAIARLADAYIRLVNGAADEDRVADLRLRIAKFLGRDQVADQYKLRLALARADYRMALRGIERLRQGQIDKAGQSQTSASLLHALESLDQLFDQLTKRIEENRLLAAGADEQKRIALTAEMDDESDLLMATKFLRAWCRYWLLWIDRSNGTFQSNPASPWQRQATDLVAVWSDLLETGKALPEPSDCSTDLLSEEYYAQSVLGMALTKALQSDMAVADGWFEILRRRGVWEGLSDFSNWYLQALVDTRSYERANVFLQKSSETLNCPAVVGAALRAIAESSSSPQAIEFAKSAVAVAADQSDFASVRRLASRVPALADGSGFAACLARGIHSYDEGRSATDPKLKVSCLESASRELTLAVDTAQAAQQPAAAVLELLAWSKLGAGHACEAAESFVLASNQLAGHRADEALWMAVESLAKGGCPDAKDGSNARRFELAREYLTRFEAGTHSTGAAIILSRAPGAEKDDALAEHLVRDAMREGESSASREPAASLLYRSFRAARDTDRAKEAIRLLTIPPQPVEIWPAGSVDIVVRQQLEAALDPAVLQIEEAKRLLQRIATKYPVGEEPMEFRCELAVRRLGLALSLQNFQMALDSIGTIRKATDPQWRPVAEAIFVRTMESMLAQGSLTPQQASDAQLGIIAARRALRDAARKSGDAQRADEADIQLGRTLLNAARALRASAAPVPTKGTDAQAMSQEALSIARGILANRPDDAHAFALMADAGIAAGDFNAAYEALARLVGALPVRSDAWFERKADLCELMLKSSPDEVRKILSQHVVLIPDWGPGVGGARLKALADRLGVVSPVKPDAAEGAK